MSPKNYTLSLLVNNAMVILATLLVSLIMLLPVKSYSQTDVQDYEEITVFMMVQNIGAYEIDAIYSNDDVYLNLSTLFNLFKVNNVPSRGNDSITGFFLDENNRYSVNLQKMQAVIGKTRYEILPSEVIRTDFGLFLKSSLYGKLFGLNMSFNFRSLSVDLKTNHELPIIKELRREQMRKNLDRLSGKVIVDTTIYRKYHLLRGGMADWSIISTQTENKETDTRASIGLGGELLGGELTAFLNYSSVTGFDDRQQQYKWRWVNNESPLIKQVSAGKIPLRATSSIYAPVIGASITNTPTTFRRSFGTYILTDYTEPGWTVELYVNNILIDFATADASGLFSFNVPLVYGNSQVTLRFYGPWGEERIREQTLNIPYNFLPAGKVEYNVTGGVLQDSANNIFSRAEAQAGISRNLTVGAGVEYLSSIEKNNTMPFMNASARVFNRVLVTGEYTHGVKTRGLINYMLPSNASFELDYTTYVKEQKAISFNYLEERRASLTLPVKIGSVRSFTRLAFRQNVLPQTTYSTAEMLISTSVYGVNANISTFSNWLPEGNPFIYSTLSLGFRLPKSFIFRPQLQYDFTNSRIISYKTELEKSFNRNAHLTLMFDNNINSNTKNIEVTFRYDLSFAQTAISTRIIGKRLSTTESARGNLSFGSGNGYVHADNRTSTGRGGITIRPYLDLNNNNKFDENEPLVSGLIVRLNGGRLIKQKKDSLIRVIDLEPFASYLLEINDVGLENIAWQLNQKTYSVFIDPNQFKKIDIAVKVMGEASGTVYLKKANRTTGQGRIILNFYNEAGKLIHKLMTESDGYFNYLGLQPGNYIVMPDSSQLTNIGYSSQPESFKFTIKQDQLGDIIDGITFTLTPNEEPAIQQESEHQDQGAIQNQQTEHSSVIIPENTLPHNNDKAIKGEYSENGIYFVQAGAYLKLKQANELFEKVEKINDLKTAIIYNAPYYKVRAGKFKTYNQASKVSQILSSNGFESFIGK